MFTLYQIAFAQSRNKAVWRGVAWRGAARRGVEWRRRKGFNKVLIFVIFAILPAIRKKQVPSNKN